MASKMSTLCYIEKDGKYLMLHRTVKENDVNKDKWIGVGGHFEHGESPEECLLREVKEETGYTLTSWKYRGLVTFVYGEDVVEYMSLYTADGFEGEPVPCDEGELEWIDKEKVWSLELWEGDKVFFRLLDEGREFFSLKLVYDENDVLRYAALDGKALELFDERNPDGTCTGRVKERGVAHREGALHATVHTWIVRPNEGSGYDVLLQKRSETKDSNPGCYDISSAGHVESGYDYPESAVRELEEELGIRPVRSSSGKWGPAGAALRVNFTDSPLRMMNSAGSICMKSRWISRAFRCRRRSVGSDLDGLCRVPGDDPGRKPERILSALHLCRRVQYDRRGPRHPGADGRHGKNRILGEMYEITSCLSERL